MVMNRFIWINGNNLPLHIVINKGQHHHLYYDNGWCKGAKEMKSFQK